jgi:hypothetical protein
MFYCCLRHTPLNWSPACWPALLAAHIDRTANGHATDKWPTRACTPNMPRHKQHHDSKRAQCLQYMACWGAVIGYTSGLQVCAVLHTAVAKYTVVICCRCCRHTAASHQRCGMHALNTVIAARTSCVRRGCAAAEAATCIIRKHATDQQPYYMQAAPAACQQQGSHRNAHS